MTKRDAFLALLLGCPCVLTACALNPTPLRCPSGAGSPMRVFELYFGRAIAGRGDLTDAEWKEFGDEVIAPNLRDGFTVLDGEGAWRSPRTQTTIRESTKILITSMPDTAASEIAVGHVRDAYKTEFRQIAVGMTSYVACGSFY